MSSDQTSCPCGLSGTVESCCGRYIFDGLPAPAPDLLMRSRYCAFTLGTPKAVDYLVETHHKDFRQPNLHAALKATVLDVTWMSLEIREASQEGNEGIVEFVATYKHDDCAYQLQERSSFLREDGRWYYTTGELDPAQNGPL
jgi:SEC-C motif domain protein